KVLDFGISKLTILDPKADEAMKRVVTQETVVLGSPSYMSPEQVRGQKDVDERTDVWSLGAILYELLTGKEPFGSDDPKKVFARVLEEEPVALEVQRADMPPGLADVVMRALTKDRAKRFDDVDAFATALARFLKKGDAPAPGWRDAIQVDVDLESMVLKRAAAAETFVLPERRSGKLGKILFALALLALLGGAGTWYGVKSGKLGTVAAAAPDSKPPPEAPVASAPPAPSSAASVVAVADTASSTALPSASSPHATRGRRVPRARGGVTAPPDDPTPGAAAPAPAPSPAAPDTSAKYHRTDW
ncbi:MAG TPA: protein kinase, partial [Labilithrix sp.]